MGIHKLIQLKSQELKLHQVPLGPSAQKSLPKICFSFSFSALFSSVLALFLSRLPTRWQRSAVQNSHPSVSDYLSASSSSTVPGLITILLRYIGQLWSACLGLISVAGTLHRLITLRMVSKEGQENGWWVCRNLWLYPGRGKKWKDSKKGDDYITFALQEYYAGNVEDRLKGLEIY